MSFLDDPPPLKFSDPLVRSFRDNLVSVYPDTGSIRSILQSAGVPTAGINMQGSATVIWHNALTVAANSGTLKSLYEAVIADSDASAIFAELKEQIGDPRRVNVTLAPARASEWGAKEGREKLEKILAGRSTLLNVGFLRRGLEAAKGVFRIDVRGRRGTAFRVGPMHILSAHHVVFASERSEAPNRVSLLFDYEEGSEPQRRTYGVRRIFGRKNLSSKEDWSLIEVDEELPKEVPILELSRHAPERDGLAYIIQHPGGTEKQIALYRNVIRHVDEQIVQYISDTAKGSSGSPVFDEDWQVIALHYRWVETDPGVELDLDTGSFDRNEGMRIEVIREKLRELLG